jgi:hypothetical protein
MQTWDDIPDTSMIPENSWLCSDSERKAILSLITEEIFYMFVNISYNRDDNNFSFKNDKLAYYQMQF